MDHDVGTPDCQAGGDPPEDSESAASSWLVAECRTQAMLYSFLEAVRRTGRVPTASPAPIDLEGERGLETAIEQFRPVVHDGSSKGSSATRMASGIRSAVQAALDAVDAFLVESGSTARLAASTPKGSCEYVRWWTATAERIREFQAAIVRAEAAEKRSAAQATPKSGGIFQRIVGKTPAPKPPEDVPSSRRLQGLLQEVRAQIGDRHPVFWIADQEGPLQLTEESLRELAGRKRFLDVPGSTPTFRDCLEKLIAACGELRYVPGEGGGRQPCSAESFRVWRRHLLETASVLLGEECKEAPTPWPVHDSVSHWDVQIAGAMAADVLARPLLRAGADQSEHESPPLAAGVVVIPRVDRLLDRLRAWQSEASATGSPPPQVIVKAINSVTLDEGAVRFSDLLFRDGRPRAIVVNSLLQFTRLITALEWHRDDSPAEPLPKRLSPPDELRVVAGLEGLVIEPALDAGARQIPRRADDRRAGAPATPLALRLRDAGALSIGTPSQPSAANCEVLDAVEDLDWRLWAIQAAAATACIAMTDDSRKSLTKLLDRARHDEWEVIKARLLRSDRDSAKLAAAVLHLVLARLQVAQTSSPDELTAVLSQENRRLSLVLLGTLHDEDAEGLGGLHPPRSRNGDVDCRRWWIGGFRGEGKGPAWEVAWRADPAPFGTQLEEYITASKTIRVTFSASPAATADDLRILGSPLVAGSLRGAAGAYVDPLARFSAEIIPTESHVGAMPNLAAALGRLRDDLAGPSRAAFHALVEAATAAPADPLAAQCLALLRAEARFNFACHPSIDPVKDGVGFHVRPPASADVLTWEDSDAVPAGADLRLVYAIEPRHGTRVLSRGRPAEGSPEWLAGNLEGICAAELPGVAAAATAVREAIDRLRTFPEEKPRWMKVFAESLCVVLDGLANLGVPMADDGAGDVTSREAVVRAFGVASRLAGDHGHRLTPENWDPQSGTPGPELTACEGVAAAFHPSVPSGNWIVDRFGLIGEQGRQGVWRLSAGQPPPGYEPLCALAAKLPEDEPCRNLRRELADLPRHVLDEKSRLAIPSLYETLWKVVAGHPAVGDQAAWKDAIAGLIRKPLDMVMFEPTKLADYPYDWIVGPDGGVPRGRRVVRVVRPGVRTLAKKLVWPAIVETE